LQTVTKTALNIVIIFKLKGNSVSNWNDNIEIYLKEVYCDDVE